MLKQSDLESDLVLGSGMGIDMLQRESWSLTTSVWPRSRAQSSGILPTPQSRQTDWEGTTSRLKVRRDTVITSNAGLSQNITPKKHEFAQIDLFASS